jgi:Ser/Thr protein kinase RdoA (MazF antagonist)
MNGEGPTPDALRERARERRRRLEGRLAEAALARYGLRGTSFEPLSQSFVQVFGVASRRGWFVLRLYDLPRPAGEKPGPEAASRTGATLRSEEVLRSQLLWLSALGRQTELSVPEPVALPDGSLLGRISAEELEPRGSRLRRASRRLDAEELQRDLGDAPRMVRNFVLLRWVAGDRKQGEELGPEDMSLAGSYVARLHLHAEGYAIPAGSVFPRWDWERVFGESANLWSEGEAFYSEEDMDAFREASRHVREELLRLGEGRGVFGVIHRDPKLENLVFDGARVGAVDFDLCGLGHYLLDVCTMRDSLRTHHADRLERLWDAFLAGYERERGLPEELPRHLATFEVMRKVSMVNRQLRLLGTENDPRQLRSPEFLSNVASWLKDMRRGWGALPAGFLEVVGELPRFAVEFAAIL